MKRSIWTACALVMGALALQAAEEELATIVFMRSAMMGGNDKLNICRVSEGEAIALGAMRRRGKITRSLPPGDYQFIAYWKGGNLTGPNVESYLEATLAAGRTYYVMAPHRFEGAYFLPYTGVVVEFGFPLVPFKKDAAGGAYALDSIELYNWLTGTPESHERVELTPIIAKRIGKQLPRLKKFYDQYRAKHGDAFVLAVEDSFPKDQAIAGNLASSLTDGVDEVDGEPLGNHVARFGFPADLDSGQVREAILLGGTHRGYELVGQAEDRLVFRLENSGYDATYTVVYDAGGIEMYSKTHRVKDPATAVEKQSWIANLQQSISAYLSRSVERDKAYAEILDQDPEGFAAQDLGEPIDSFPVPTGLEPGDVQAMIAKAGEHRHYSVVGRAEGLIALRLLHRGYNATYVFSYDDQTVKMHSRVSKAKRPGKWVQRKGWAENLKATIHIYFERKAL